MKNSKLSYCIFFLALTVALLAGCTDESIVSGGRDNKSVSLYFTTPTLSNASVEFTDSSIKTKGDHSSGEAQSKQDMIKNLYFLLFDGENGVLMFAEKMTIQVDGTGTVALSYNGKGYVRLAANVSPEGWKGKSWESLKNEQTFTISGKDSYPMYADVGEQTITNSLVIGSAQTPIKLKRSVAKLTVSATSEITFSGFRTFNRHKEGYLFPQDPIRNVSANIEDEHESAYDNGKKSIFLPETKNTDEDHQTFIIVKATHNGVEGYYRIDMRNDKKLIDIERNKHYIIKFGKNMGYGYPTPEEALTDPYNDESDSVVIEEHSSYDFIYNENQNYMGFSNSTVVIFGKAEYCTNGFSPSNKTTYKYVLTMIKTDSDGSDVSIEDNGGLEITKKIIDKEGGKYVILSAPVAGLEGDLDENGESGAWRTVTIRYKNMIKTLTVVWKGTYIDCTYSHENIAETLGNSATYAEVKPHLRADGTEEAYPSGWIGLSTEEINADSSGSPLISHLSGGNGDKYVQFREHVDGLKMGIKSTNAPNEGFRFADVYLSSGLGEGMVKIIYAQANADLNGYFGGTSLAEYTPVNNDDGTQYDSYLVSERITDEIGSSDLMSYCKSKNPSDKQGLWYLPSSRQLMGLWLSDNSNSRKTSPMDTAPAEGPTYRYISRSNYTQAHIDYYEWTKTFTFIEGYTNLRNADSKGLNDPSRYWRMNFSNGETIRDNTDAAIRCVRNLSGEELPSDIQSKITHPVSGRQATMDPAGYLSDDYFDQSVGNPIARKIEVLPKTTEMDNTVVYTWTPTAGSIYLYWKTESKGLILKDYLHYYSWAVGPGWERNGKELYPKDKGNEYTVGWTSTSTPPVPQNSENVHPTKSIEKEYTLTNAFNRSISAGGRLPSMRELLLIYIYHDWLVAGGMDRFYVDEADGYYEGSSISIQPNRLLYQMFRYPAANHIPYMHWYWTSTTRAGKFTGTDGSSPPLRVNFHFGDVNARGANETTAMDHYRAVKTVN